MAKSGKKKKKRKKHNPVIDWFAYVLLRILVVFLSFFDIKTNLNTACLLGRLLWKHYHRGRKRALDNLRASFPEKDEKWIWQTGQRSFEHIVMLAMDVLFTPRLTRKHNWSDYAMCKGAERTKWMMHVKRGLIMLTGHYGNFEIIGYMMGLFGFNIYGVARPLDNKFISDYLYGVRKRHGQQILDKKGAAKYMEQILASGATLCFIADQDAGRKGIFVDFFGRKASTYKSIGLIALACNVPIVVGCSRRIDNLFKFEMKVNRIIMPEEWADKDKQLEWITAEYTKAIEDFIREDPTQYWWLHRRWKHRPKDESN
ncbi:MAG: lysophospholipid acyltransferase family protein [Sedimentisphaerales bacterium]